MLVLDKEKYDMTYAAFPKELKLEIIEIYLKEYPVKLKNIETYFGNNDMNALSKEAHSLKGIVGSMFAEETRLICRKIEEKAMNGEEDALEPLIANLKESLEKVLSDIDDLKSSLN